MQDADDFYSHEGREVSQDPVWSEAKQPYMTREAVPNQNGKSRPNGPREGSDASCLMVRDCHLDSPRGESGR